MGRRLPGVDVPGVDASIAGGASGVTTASMRWADVYVSGLGPRDRWLSLSFPASPRSGLTPRPTRCSSSPQAVSPSVRALIAPEVLLANRRLHRPFSFTRFLTLPRAVSGAPQYARPCGCHHVGTLP